MPAGEEQKKGFMWRLTEQAINEGVKSTTRYRSKLPNKRARAHTPALKRQTAGAKGGQAAKKAAKRRSERLRHTTINAACSSGYSSMRSSPCIHSPALASLGRKDDFGYGSRETFGTFGRSVSPYYHLSPACYPSENEDIGTLSNKKIETQGLVLFGPPRSNPIHFSTPYFPDGVTGIHASDTPHNNVFHHTSLETLSNASYPVTPGSEMHSGPPMDLLPCESLFYGSPMSTDEPTTPHDAKVPQFQEYIDEEANLQYEGVYDLGFNV
jgi:hypothetical protein